MDWKPIETVQTDKRVLLWCSDLLGEQKYDALTERFVRQPKGIVFGRAYMGHDGKSYPKGDGMNGDWTFTHWMPLPDPPHTSTRSDKEER